jgi:transposase
MKGRHDISDAAWEAIEDCIPERRVMGRPPRDPRQVLNGVLWILRTGAPWRDLPEYYGPWPTVYYRFRVWEREGVVDCILKRLQTELNAEGGIDWDLWCIDGTSIRASKAAAGAPKRGAAKRSRTRR